MSDSTNLPNVSAQEAATHIAMSNVVMGSSAGAAAVAAHSAIAGSATTAHESTAQAAPQPSASNESFSAVGTDHEKQTEARRAHESGKKVTVRTFAMVAAIIVGILFVLFVVSRAALYDSIFAMLGDMGTALAEVIRRIFSW